MLITQTKRTELENITKQIRHLDRVNDALEINRLFNKGLAIITEAGDAYLYQGEKLGIDEDALHNNLPETSFYNTCDAEDVHNDDGDFDPVRPFVHPCSYEKNFLDVYKRSHDMFYFQAKQNNKGVWQFTFLDPKIAFDALDNGAGDVDACAYDVAPEA